MNTKEKMQEFDFETTALSDNLAKYADIKNRNEAETDIALFFRTMHTGTKGYVAIPKKLRPNQKGECKWYGDFYYNLSTGYGEMRRIDPKTGEKFWQPTKAQGIDNAVVPEINNYISVQMFKIKRRRKTDCAQICGYLADLDFHDYTSNAEADTKIEGLLAKIYAAVRDRKMPQPTAIVLTGRGVQMHWRLRQTLAVTAAAKREFEKTNLCLITALEDIVGAKYADAVDKTVTDLARVCRMPGTYNVTANRMSALLACDPDCKYTQGEIWKLFNLDSKAPAQITKESAIKDTIDKDKTSAPAKKIVTDTATTKSKTETKAETKEKPHGYHGCGDGYRAEQPTLAANIYPGVPSYYRPVCKKRVAQMQKMPLERLVEGTGRRDFVFLYYNHCRTFLLEVDAVKACKEINAQFGVPLPESELQEQLQRIICHAEGRQKWNLHSDGIYVFSAPAYAEFLPGVLEAEEIALAKHKETLQMQKNKANSMERDKEIAELYKTGMSYRAIAKQMQEEGKYKYVSTDSVKRAIARMQLSKDRNYNIEDIRFEAVATHAEERRKTKEKKVGAKVLKSNGVCVPPRPQSAPSVSHQLFSSSSSGKDVDQKVDLMDSHNVVSCSSEKMDREQEQIHLWKVLDSGINVFVTGSSGTGKTFSVLKWATAKENEGRKVLRLAPTALAAKLIGGKTMQSALGVPVGAVLDFSQIPFYVMHSIKDYNVIVVDEIGMVRADLFTWLVTCVRETEVRYGVHIQVVACGDFRQLKPVCTVQEYNVFCSAGRLDLAGYAFLTRYWNGTFNETVCLHHVWRQEDVVFASALDALARGDRSVLPYFNNRVLPVPVDKPMLHLCGYRKDADAINQDCVDRYSKDNPDTAVFVAEGNVQETGVPAKLTVYPGLPVVFTINKKHYKNGQRGTVVKVGKKQVRVQLDTGAVIAVGRITLVGKGVNAVKQLPFTYGYAVTVHKAQGMSLDAAVVHPSSFEVGQLYVALSRVRSLDGLYLTESITPKDLRIDSQVLDFVRTIA